MLSTETVRRRRAALAFVSAFSFAFAFFQPASAATEIPIYSFQNAPDGANPDYGVVQGPGGVLYGATASGGATFGGVIYQLTPPNQHHSTWQEKVIYNFTGGTKGKFPVGPLVFDVAGNAYGTAQVGGDTADCGGGGCGLVFQLRPPTDGKKKWTYKILHAFNGADGKNPSGALTIDSNGNLYGATRNGGTDNFCTDECGVLFKLAPPLPGKTKWKYTTLYIMQHAFGAIPNGGMVFDATESALYGTAVAGGTSPSSGVAFELKAPRRKGSWTYSVLHNFTGDTGDGGQPNAGMTFDLNGNLYGTTLFGGSTNCSSGCGTVFELSQSGGHWTETPVHIFTGGTGDGRGPLSGLAFDGASMYGTTQAGGGSGCGNGCGTVFKMTLSPFNFAKLYSFNNGNDGSVPQHATPILRDDELLYGTASSGGGPFAGVVYSMTTTP